jgi:hypothetical protein
MAKKTKRKPKAAKRVTKKKKKARARKVGEVIIEG